MKHYSSHVVGNQLDAPRQVLSSGVNLHGWQRFAQTTVRRVLVG